MAEPGPHHADADAGACSPPLAGFRVLDLTRLLPGPVCTLYLADLGADVVKVEDTGAGDYARTLGARHGGVSSFFRAVNRNKRSIALDLKDARGRDAFNALAKHADVLVESFRPGVMAALGIDYEAIAKIAPRIVYASISGYGQTGPRANLAGHDINYLGYAGVLDQTGARNGPPALSNLQIADLLGGAASAAIALLAALVDAQRTGRGRHIDVAMADASLAHNVMPLSTLDEWGALRPRGDDLLTGGVPCYGVYPTQDGRWLAVGALEQKFWKTLCASLERSDLVASPVRAWRRRRSRQGRARAHLCRRAACRMGREARDGRLLRDADRDARRGARRSAVRGAGDGRDAARWLARIRAAVQGFPARIRASARGAAAGRAQRASSARGRLRRCGDRRARRGGCGQGFLTGFAPLRTAPTGSAATRANSGSGNREPAAT